MLAAIHSSIQGIDVILALLVVLAAVVLERLVPPIAWVAWSTLFLAALLTFTLLFDL